MTNEELREEINHLIEGYDAIKETQNEMLRLIMACAVARERGVLGDAQEEIIQTNGRTFARLMRESREKITSIEAHVLEAFD